MKSVEKIEKKLPELKRRKRVAAYARISMETERMRHSLSAQISYYSSYIQKNPEWEYAGVYADSGISGTGTKNRTEFNRMIADCEAGKIDIVLTKSIQRFARNTVDLLETVRHLKDIGVEVRFEKENINSMSGDGELMMSILASFAQEESRSISENVKWGTVKRFKQGIPNGRFQIYGYRWEGDHLVIEPNEAKIVRLIYDNFLNGLSAEATEKQLEEMGVKSYKGMHFSNSSIRQILGNITYTGNLLFQKEYTVDPISKKSRINRGELPQYWVPDTHEAIISLETYQKVQDEIARRRKLGAIANPHIPTSCFTSKLKCSQCGRSYRRHSYKRMDDTFVSWGCRGKDDKGVKFCDAKNVPNEALIHSCCDVLGLDEFDEDVFLEKVEYITVCPDNLLIFHMTDGSEVSHTWEFKSTAKSDWWTPERKKNWGELHKNKDTNPNKHLFYEFTGFIKCGCCGANYRSQSRTMTNGVQTRHWHCSAPRTNCHNPSIKDETMKRLVTEVLGLSEFDEDKMDAAIEYASILEHTVTFHFRDGHTESRDYLDRRVGNPWTEERRIKQTKAIREGRRWRKDGENSNNNSGNTEQVHSSAD